MAVNVKSPTSFFFTESLFVQQSGTDKSFGPLSESEFQITTKFSGAFKAFAAVSGTLFYAQYGTYGDKINAILKPDKDLGLGLKIKYFIYRGLDFNEVYKQENGKIKKQDKNSPILLQYLDKVWDEYIEFNGTNQDFEASKSGFEAASSTPKKLINKFFTNNEPSNLLRVERGTHIGTFVNGFGGFEIVLDDGDFSQVQSDTFLELDEKYITATECILKVDGTHTSVGNDKIFGGNTLSGNEKIFRENVYRFIDPAAFYGAHITDTNDNNINGGKILVKSSNSVPVTKQSKTQINDIVKKFNNRDRIYIYVRGERGRSHNFYKPEAERTIKYYGSDVPFNTAKWPLLIKSVFSNATSIGFDFNINNIVESNVRLKEVGLGPRPSNYLLDKVASFIPNLPFEDNKNISYIIFLNYFNGENVLDNLFGNVNLKPIFEQEDFSASSKAISYVNHLRPVIIKEDTEIGIYATKLVLEGRYISTSNPPSLSNPLTDSEKTELEQNLRTYILFPQIETKKKEVGDAIRHPSVTAGYIAKVNGDYIEQIYKRGEVWRGIINDSGAVKSLLYRRKDIDDDMPIYQLGISQSDYLVLLAHVAAGATNLFYTLEMQLPITDEPYIKYKLRIKYDSVDGTPATTSSHVMVYTVDGFFFFSKNYSANLEMERCKEFASIAIDFLPNNLSSYNYGYEECGFDYVGFEGREHYKDIVGMYYDSSGKPKNITKEETITFNPTRLRYLQLLARNYDSKPTNWRTSFPFHTNSYITLYSGESTTIKCKVTKDKNPAKLFYKYNAKYISIDNPAAAPTVLDSIATKEISSFTDHTITVKALQKFDVDQVIEVVDEKQKTAGKLHILANKYIGGIKILLVNCQTYIPGTLPPDVLPKEGLPSGNHTLVENILTRFLKQIYITPTFIHEPLNLSNNINFKKTGGAHVFSGTEIIKSTQAMFDYCYTLLQNPDKSTAMVLMFFDEEGALENETGGVGTKLNGEANALGGANGARIFKNGKNKNTIAHEALHSLGLYHSFDINGEYTFKQSVEDADACNDTDNVMDYFFDFDDKKRKLIWKWQMKKVYGTDNDGRLIKK